MYFFSLRSLKNLDTCHRDLRRIATEAINYVDFAVICGHRSEKEQNLVFDKGYSQVRFPNSRHNKFPSLAMDCIPYPTFYKSTSEFYYMAGVIISCAKKLDILLEWGGRWGSFIDLPHFQLKL